VRGEFVCHPRRVTVAAGPNRRRLVVQVAAGVVCLAVIGFALWLVAGFAGGDTPSGPADQRVLATVTSTASCQGSDTQDSVSVHVDGQTRQAKLDGCGHQKGEAVGVLVPTDFTAGSLLEPAAAAPTDTTGKSHQVAFLLLLVATAIGGVLGYRFFHTRGATPVRRPRQQAADDAEPPVDDYHSDIRPVTREHDPDETGVDWFEDSATRLDPVPPPADVQERADQS
jgi:hypothetical protein